MITISLCMIVKDEEKVLDRCLSSVAQAADEIIVVDTGSSDSTKKIVEKYTRAVFDFPWTDDFAAARNFSFSKATKEFILWLDADDVLLSEDLRGLLQLKNTLDPQTDVVMMKYNAAFDSEGRPTFSYERERLIKNCPEARWKGAVHEVIVPFGTIIHSDVAVTHKKEGPGDPDRNLRIFERLLKEGIPLEPRQQYYYARELYYHGRYKEAVSLFQDFMNAGQGWVEDVIGACQLMAYCYYQLNEESKALQALLRSLEFDLPRGELCCDIGKHFLDRNRLEQAVYWYEQAACAELKSTGGFRAPDCYGFTPNIQLCVCHDRLGNPLLAAEYNEKAARYKPDHPAVHANRTYFSSMKNQI